MCFEDMVIAWPLLDALGEENVSLLLDLMEEPGTLVSSETRERVERFLKSLIHEFGEDHPAAQQVARVVSNLASRSRTV